MVVVNGRIKGKDRPKFNTKTGRAYTSKETSTYENWVRINYQEQDGRYLEGPIVAIINAFYEIPKSYTKKRIRSIMDRLEYPCKKPDADNVAKIILDSLNGIAFKDDSQVVELIIHKRYAIKGNERVEFDLQQI